MRWREGLPTDFSALRYWAERANYQHWREDPIGRLYGVGLITYQYLRMQAGINTTMPDKIIKRVIERDFNITAVDDLEFIQKLETFSEEVGYSQTFICWAIWLKESDQKVTGWEQIN
jgi:hypothetical protein